MNRNCIHMCYILVMFTSDTCHTSITIEINIHIAYNMNRLRSLVLVHLLFIMYIHLAMVIYNVLYTCSDIVTKMYL